MTMEALGFIMIIIDEIFNNWINKKMGIFGKNLELKMFFKMIILIILVDFI
jgi:hypothetical protein